MALQWFFIGAAVLAALAAFIRAGRAAKRLERLSESYWELRYEHGQMSARLARLEGSADGVPDRPRPADPESTNFVSLASLRKK